MKKLLSYVAVVLFGLDTVVSMDVLLHSSDMQVLSITVVIWGIYAMLALGAITDACHEDTQRLLGHDRRKFWKENRKFWKEYDKKMKEMK